MATGVDAIILAALLEHLKELEFMPPLQIAIPGVAFPSAGQTKPDNYLAAFFMPNQTRTITVAGGPQQHRGLLQVSVFWKSGAGLIKPLNCAGQIIEHFTKDTTLFSSGLKIRIDRKPWSAPPIQENDRTQIPVSISYHTFG